MSSPIVSPESVLEYERRAEQCWREAKERRLETTRRFARYRPQSANIN